MFINDLTLLEDCYLFADDCLVFASGHNPELAAKELEESLVNYTNWYNSNMLVLNAAKTNVITLSNKTINSKLLPKVKFQSIRISQKK